MKKTLIPAFKARYYDQYRGQIVCYHPFINRPVKLTGSIIDSIEDGSIGFKGSLGQFISLRSISDLTDEEIIKMLTDLKMLMGWRFCKALMTPCYYQLRRPFEDNGFNIDNDGFEYRTVSIDQTTTLHSQYLITIGVAVDMYDPEQNRTVQVSEVVENGLVVIRK